MPRFEITTVIAADPARCFELSLSVDAHAASMTGSRERPVDGISHGLMKLGDTVTWRARHFGIWFRMTSAITAYEYPVRFVDEQVRGPFARWWHEHRFEASPQGGTQMTDVVEFRSPAGPLGRLVDEVLLSRYMRHLIHTRNAWLKGTLERAT